MLRYQSKVEDLDSLLRFNFSCSIPFSVIMSDENALSPFLKPRGSNSSNPEISLEFSTIPFKNLSNSYFIHHYDHSGLVLVSKPLNGDNYCGWKIAMIQASNSKNKLIFVNGSIKAPIKEADPEGYAMWWQCNNMPHCWIVNSSDPEITNNVTYYASTHEVWDDLQEHFSQGNPT